MFSRFASLAVCGALLITIFARTSPPPIGPETEKRFPPLKLPAGFKATLFACDPLVEYPSAVARGPRTGSIFVAADYLTGLGTGITRRDEIHLIEDTNADGYGDKKTIFAGGFNSIQGLTFDGETVFVMHSPFLTAVRDTNGDGVADQRTDLLNGLGLSPEEDQIRLHNANGVAVGHDGWLYLALGDHGCKVTRPEGDRLVLEGGGILRCRSDGRDLHVFARGLRNIYDVAFDEELNVFVRDNENDGGEYKIRLCHSFFGADHGYPYLYIEHPDEALPPLADLGLGSSAGGVCYLENQFPQEFRGNLFFCEWGRSVVRYRPNPLGGGFAPLKEEEFAAGSPSDPYGFKPTDVIVQRDGSLIVVDWADDQRPRRGRGRVYRIEHVQTASKPQDSATDATIARWITHLDSESYYARTEAQTAIERRGPEGVAAVRKALTDSKLGARGRFHVVWILARHGGPEAVNDLFDLVRNDADARVQAQAVRALADLSDPVLVQHRLDASSGDAKVAARLADLSRNKDPRVLLEIIIAMARLHWGDAPGWLARTLNEPDAAISHAAMQTMRSSRNWPAVVKLLDLPSNNPVKRIAMRAIANQAEVEIVDALVSRLTSETDAARRGGYADLLGRVYKKPGPWVYWGFRPPPRPANPVAWERTAVIEQTLNQALVDSSRDLRLALFRRMQREAIPVQIEKVGQWLADDRDNDRVAAILQWLGAQPIEKARSHLDKLIVDRAHTTKNRLTSLAIIARASDKAGPILDLAICRELEEGPVLAAALPLAAKHSNPEVVTWLTGKLNSPAAEVRAAALESLAEIDMADISGRIPQFLADKAPGVRRAAAFAAGKKLVRPATDSLLNLVSDPDPSVRQAALNALCQLRESKALPLALAALNQRETEMAALKCVAGLGGPDQAATLAELARKNLSSEVGGEVVRILAAWADRQETSTAETSLLHKLISEIQGATGGLLCWKGLGPMSASDVSAVVPQIFHEGENALTKLPAKPRRLVADGIQSPVKWGSSQGSPPNSHWLAYTDIVAEPMNVQLLTSSTGNLAIWLNGQRVPAGKERGNRRFDAALSKGANRLLLEITSPKETVEFQVSFRRKSSKAEHERLAQMALYRRGDPERGRKVMLDIEKSQCLKCHRLGDQGERIGPELTGIGSRFARVHVLESILEPSRTIAPGFQTVAVSLKDGRLLAGIRLEETNERLTIADNQGQKHVLKKSDVETRQIQPVSAMPDGLETRLTATEFVDLIEFLGAQKEAPESSRRGL